MTTVLQDDGRLVFKARHNTFSTLSPPIPRLVVPKSGRILYLDVDFHKFRLTRGSSYIELPKWVASKKAVINPPVNEDEECFKWAVIAPLHHEEIGKNPNRISQMKPYVDIYNWEGIEFPASIKSIHKLGANNPGANNPDIAVNVLYVTEKKINILRRSVQNGRTKVVTLLYITDHKKTHYTAVKSLSRLLG
ncbi:uncharacterized protein LOC130654655 [Hydractinia symbiolongicarpus]|uniref:uncharacterized protein LOC130654655 n=1 Tax=Hydractinia symbiolongicarpus TaxID=13093 RepID=UPI002550D1EB|nr:uncharacterized protein LOC130654655 [Hydractinia symbiolongicarpus]